MEKTVLLSGNEAVGEGAIQAGCRFYAGYPITPQNELTEYMSRRMPEVGGVFIQSESELAAISMVFGASASGVRAMTTSSSPGISLMQEGISYLVGAELPAVIVNIVRGGPGLGNIAGAQSDYFQATKGGGHGDYRLIVLAPASVQEMADYTEKAFYLSDKYRNPVMILSDGILGQMMEPTIIRTPKENKLPPKDWALTGARGREPRVIKSMYLKEGALEKHNEALQKKYREAERKICYYEEVFTQDAETLLVGYGTSSRILRAVVSRLREEGMKIGMVRPISLWPFPTSPIERLSERVKFLLVVEMSAGQMVEDVRLAVNGRCPVHFYGRMGGGIPTEKEVIKAVKKLGGKRG